MSMLLGSSAVLKSITQSSITIANASGSNTASVNVVQANSILVYQGCESADASTDENSFNARITLSADGQTVTATRVGTAQALVVRFAIFEFYPGVLKSCQYGTVTLTATSTNTAAISSVDITKASAISLGFTNSGSTGTTGQNVETSVTLTNATTVTSTRGGSTDNVVLSFVVPEFY